MVTMKMIAKRIKQAREEVGMNQTEAGAAIGLSQPQYSLIEQGKSKGLSVTKLVRLADAFGVSPAWLMAETDDPLFGVRETPLDMPPWSAAALTAAELIDGMSVSRQNEALEMLKHMRARDQAEQRMRELLRLLRLLVGGEVTDRIEEELASGNFDVDRLSRFIDALKKNGSNQSFDAFDSTD